MKLSPSLRWQACAVTLMAALALAGCAGGPKIGGKKNRATTPTHGERIPILSRIESGAKVDADINTLAVILPPPEVNTEWAQPGGAANKSYGNLAISDHPTKLWTASIAGSTPQRRLASAPVIGGGLLD